MIINVIMLLKQIFAHPTVVVQVDFSAGSSKFVKISESIHGKEIGILGCWDIFFKLSLVPFWL